MNLEKLQSTHRIVENISVLLMRGQYQGELVLALDEAFKWTQTFKTDLEKVIADVQAEQTKTTDSVVATQKSDGMDRNRISNSGRGDSEGNSIPARSPRNRTRKTRS